MALQEGLAAEVDALGDVKDGGLCGVAVEVDDERVVPVGGNVDAIGRVVEGADFGEAVGIVEDRGFGFGLELVLLCDCEGSEAQESGEGGCLDDEGSSWE